MPLSHAKLSMNEVYLTLRSIEYSDQDTKWINPCRDQFRQSSHYWENLLANSINALVDLPVIPVSWYGADRIAYRQTATHPEHQYRDIIGIWQTRLWRTSIVPAISICAHLTSGSLVSSEGSTPLTNFLRKRAAVQLPPGLPPIWKLYDEMRIRDVMCEEMGDGYIRCRDRRWTSKSGDQIPHREASSRIGRVHVLRQCGVLPIMNRCSASRDRWIRVNTGEHGWRSVVRYVRWILRWRSLPGRLPWPWARGFNNESQNNTT